MSKLSIQNNRFSTALSVPKWKIFGTFALIGVVGGEIFYLHRLYDKKDAFASYCSKRLVEKNYLKNKEGGLCQKLEKAFFFNNLPVQEFRPSFVQAPTLPIDRQIKFIAFHDPRYLSLFAYCYFSYHRSFDPRLTTPEQLALSAAGFSIPKSELKGYGDWLKTDPGRSCVDSVQRSLGFDVVDLNKAIGDQVAIIAFNPIGAVRSDGGWDDVMREGLITISDERAHAVHLAFSDVTTESKP
jgi:hypothetical protein